MIEFLEKCKPSSWEDLHWKGANFYRLRECKNWGSGWEKRLPHERKPLMLGGPSGCGKNSILRMMEKDNNWKLVVFASTDASKAFFSEESRVYGLQRKRKMMVFLGKSKLTTEAKIDAISQNSSRIPITIVVPNIYDPKLYKMRSHCISVQFESHDGHVSMDCLVRFNKYLPTPLERQTLEEISTETQGDMRADSVRLWQAHESRVIERMMTEKKKKEAGNGNGRKVMSMNTLMRPRGIDPLDSTKKEGGNNEKKRQQGVRQSKGTLSLPIIPLHTMFKPGSLPAPRKKEGDKPKPLIKPNSNPVFMPPTKKLKANSVSPKDSMKNKDEDTGVFMDDQEGGQKEDGSLGVGDSRGSGNRMRSKFRDVIRILNGEGTQQERMDDLLGGNSEETGKMDLVYLNYPDFCGQRNTSDKQEILDSMHRCIEVLALSDVAETHLFTTSYGMNERGMTWEISKILRSSVGYVMHSDSRVPQGSSLIGVPKKKENATTAQKKPVKERVTVSPFSFQYNIPKNRMISAALNYRRINIKEGTSFDRTSIFGMELIPFIKHRLFWSAYKSGYFDYLGTTNGSTSGKKAFPIWFEFTNHPELLRLEDWKGMSCYPELMSSILLSEKEPKDMPKELLFVRNHYEGDINVKTLYVSGDMVSLCWEKNFGTKARLDKPKKNIDPGASVFLPNSLPCLAETFPILSTTEPKKRSNNKIPGTILSIKVIDDTAKSKPFILDIERREDTERVEEVEQIEKRSRAPKRPDTDSQCKPPPKRAKSIRPKGRTDVTEQKKGVRMEMVQSSNNNSENGGNKKIINKAENVQKLTITFF